MKKTPVLLQVKNLKVHFPVRGGFWNRVIDQVKAVDGVSLTIRRGDTYGLIGESGSGKSTTGKVIVGLQDATKGSVSFQGLDVTKRSARKKVNYNREIQMIFQDPELSLNPEKRIYDIIAEPLNNFDHLSKEETKMKVIKLLEIVGLGPDSLYKYPHQFSGGQRQRIGVARAVATNPKLVVADEPVSALDLSVQAQVLNFMKKIQKEFDISYLFISHDLGVVKHMCNHIAIMNRGRIVEVGTKDDIYNHPLHIYTKRLLASIPETDVNKRDEHRAKRLEVEKYYKDNESKFYDKDGNALPLIQITDSHLAAIPEEMKKGGEDNVENNS
ncbi:ATP-binding cassette domain-containing protein [Apilactobacillus apisilvae]|uniref:ATP-binding cassette domain-containing protein n=1 Tax=Apilactobacillus apisilvae TaxID=2923364 RepID=A0ABY4PFI9_9LACO|nr:ATP-binding cassette domain-containing protein [Apilactobacillus apisilvae]UQS84464.1 ATP-binding cassette domain-containing protein [Apilactobacillus apisilvae]